MITNNSKSDVIYFHGVYDNELPKAEVFKMSQSTLKSNLSFDDDEIKKQFGKYCRQKINRAERENADVRIYTPEELKDNEEILRNMGYLYEKMFRDKGIKSSFNYELTKKYIENKVLCASLAFYNDIPIGFCTYLYSNGMAREWTSAFNFRNSELNSNMVGIIHRYMKWKALLYLKNQGVVDYDWGGIDDLEHPNGRVEFKLQFGGKPFSYNNFIVGKSLIGRLAVFYLKHKQKS